MPGLVPGIHVLLSLITAKKDVDGRDNPRRLCGSPGHDERLQQVNWKMLQSIDAAAFVIAVPDLIRGLTRQSIF